MTACRRPVALHVLGVDLELKVPRQPPSEALGVCVYHFVALLDLGAGRRSPGADIDTRPSQRQAASGKRARLWLSQLGFRQSMTRFSPGQPNASPIQVPMRSPIRPLPQGRIPSERQGRLWIRWDVGER